MKADAFEEIPPLAPSDFEARHLSAWLSQEEQAETLLLQWLAEALGDLDESAGCRYDVVRRGKGVKDEHHTRGR